MHLLKKTGTKHILLSSICLHLFNKYSLKLHKFVSVLILLLNSCISSKAKRKEKSNIGIIYQSAADLLSNHQH